MTKTNSGSIIYYDSDGGPILRTVTAADVEALRDACASAAKTIADILTGKPVRNADEIIAELKSLGAIE